VALLTISIFFKDLFAVPRPAIKTETASDDDRTPTDVDSSSKAKPDVDQLSANFAQSLTLEEEIDIDASSADMILFADLLQFTVRFSRFGLNNHLQVTLEQAGVLLSLADMYDCAAMRRILQRTVAQKSTHMPWQVLALACDQDDVNLARTAISNLSENSSTMPHRMAIRPPSGTTCQNSMLYGSWNSCGCTCHQRDDMN
jgi:hypothetical protein